MKSLGSCPVVAVQLACCHSCNRIHSLFHSVDVETVPHCVSCCATELLCGGFWLLVKLYGGESGGQNQAVCLQASGLSNAVCVAFLVPEYCVTCEIVFKRFHKTLFLSPTHLRSRRQQCLAC